MTQNSFKKSNRLLSKGDFDSIREQSHFLFSKTLLAFYKKNSLKETRIGLSVSKKYGNAVKRNKLKRLIREYFRKSSYKNAGYDINLVANSNYIKKNALSHEIVEKELFKDLNNILNTLE